MQALQSTKQFCSIESGPVDVETLFLLKVMEQFTAIDKSEHQVELLRGLEGELQWDNERVVDLGEHRALSQSMGDFGT
jgi:hypothetical protein